MWLQEYCCGCWYHVPGKCYEYCDYNQFLQAYAQYQAAIAPFNQQCLKYAVNWKVCGEPPCPPVPPCTNSYSPSPYGAAPAVPTQSAPAPSAQAPAPQSATPAPAPAVETATPAPAPQTASPVQPGVQLVLNVSEKS